MKTFLYGFLVCMLFIHPAKAQITFNHYFEDRTLRIDYFHDGDAKAEVIRPDELYSYGIWAGSKVNLITPFNFGTYIYKMYDIQSNELIYSQGFDSYFKEYQTTTPAIEGKSKTFHESAIVPFPKKTVYFAIEKRDSLNQFHEIFKQKINPEVNISPLKTDDNHVKVITTLENGKPETTIDIVFIAEGYSRADSAKFTKDLIRVSASFFRLEPLKSNKHRFNIRGVYKASVQSGVTEPAAGITRLTTVNASFDALGSERYLLTEDNKSLRDVAAYAPYDAIFIMANTNRYGGGGIYNFYCVFTSDNIHSDYLMSHEFGHSFFGLADEYYTSSTAYENFYPKGFEPVEPNITANVDATTIKWKDLLTPGIVVPTPWEKESYDKIDLAWQKERTQLNEEITSLKKNRADTAKIAIRKKEYDTKSAAHDKLQLERLAKSKFAGMTGAFEGAGYQSKGLYRSSVNCIMFTRTDHFCAVCSDAMMKMMKWYGGE